MMNYADLWPCAPETFNHFEVLLNQGFLLIQNIAG